MTESPAIARFEYLEAGSINRRPPAFSKNPSTLTPSIVRRTSDFVSPVILLICLDRRPLETAHADHVRSSARYLEEEYCSARQQARTCALLLEWSRFAVRRRACSPPESTRTTSTFVKRTKVFLRSVLLRGRISRPGQYDHIAKHSWGKNAHFIREILGTKVNFMGAGSK